MGLDLVLSEFENSQEDSPEPEARVVVPDRSQTPGGESSVSEYFSCVSSPGKHRAAAEDGGGGGGIPQLHQDILRTGPLEMTQPQVLEEREAPSLSTEDSFPLYLGRARVKKIYYRHVQMKRGVAVSWDEVEVYEPVFAFFGEAEKKGEEASDIWSCLSTRQLADVSDYSKAPEEREQAGTQEESPRAETPEWLVALDSGFRCLGCCRVFPSLEVLQDHVDNAVCEGFSCHIFQHALAWLNKNKKEEDKEDKEYQFEMT
ncbi:protein FAM170A-like [Manis javanica]|uniref:protein FAM170A-like n=1 Tax=Manis javanica TaxID=9974 RepID=UPI003C6D278A